MRHVFACQRRATRTTGFAAALKRRDLAGVQAAATEREHVTLTDALSIVVLMAERGDRARTGAPRWLARLVIEHGAVGLVESVTR